MAKPEPQKRSLKFKNYNSVMAEVQSLIDAGYTSHGNWNLAQSCGHITAWLEYPMDGYPRPPLPIRAMMWVMKVTVAPRWKRRILAEGFWGGMPTAPDSVPASDAQTDQAAAAKLQAAIERFTNFDGPLHASPLFGSSDKAGLQIVNLLHAEHHLGYLEPKG